MRTIVGPTHALIAVSDHEPWKTFSLDGEKDYYTRLDLATRIAKAHPKYSEFWLMNSYSRIMVFYT